jgi:ribokinase
MIVVFGSVNLDLVTRVTKIPAPGETVLGPSYDVVPGGKGANQALAARRAGARVMLVAAVGQDAFAATALSLLAADGVDLSAVARLEAPTGAAFIAVDAHAENAIVVASGANAHAKASQLEGVSFGASDILLLQR